MIRAVFFDLVGTLIRPRQPVGQQYAAVARRFGAEMDEVALEAAFHKAMREAPALEPAGTGRGDLQATAAAERRWWEQLVRGVVGACGAPALERPAVFQEYFDELYEHFTTANAWVVYDDTPRALDGLAAAGIGAGLITNYDTRVYRVLDGLGLSSRLDPVTIPAVAGVSKPDGRIFAHALGQAGLAPAEALHVGDSLHDDYEGATAAGMAALLLDRDGRHRGAGGLRRIGRLGELFEAMRQGACPGEA